MKRILNGPSLIVVVIVVSIQDFSCSHAAKTRRMIHPLVKILRVHYHCSKIMQSFADHRKCWQKVLANSVARTDLAPRAHGCTGSVPLEPPLQVQVGKYSFSRLNSATLGLLVKCTLLIVADLLGRLFTRMSFNTAHESEGTQISASERIGSSRPGQPRGKPRGGAQAHPRLSG